MRLLPPNANRRSLWLQYQGLLLATSSRRGTGITPHKVNEILSEGVTLGDRWDQQLLLEAVDKVMDIGGAEEETLRTYLLFLNKTLWIKVAARRQVQVIAVRAAVIGLSNSSEILDELEREIQLQQSVQCPDDAAHKQLIARPAMYRGLYTRVAGQLGLSVSFVSRVAAGKKKSPRVEQALAAEALRIETSLKTSEVQQ